MMDKIVAEARNPSVKVRQLRRSGYTPCAIYGGSLPEPIMIQIDSSTALRLLRKKRVGSQVRIETGGKVILSQIKDVSRNFVSEEIEHIGFQALSADKKVNSVAQVVLLNKESVQGIVEQLVFEVPYSAFPEDMIDTVTVDLADYGAGSTLAVGELEAFRGDKIELQIDPETYIFKIVDRRRSSND